MLAHDLGLEAANRRVVGDELAVQVRQADAVGVDQDKEADTGAHEGVRRVPADAAEAEHGDLRAGKPLHGGGAEEKPGAGEFVKHGAPPHRRTAATVWNRILTSPQTEMCPR